MLNALRPLLLVLAAACVLPAQAQDEPRDRSSERESAGDRVRQVERDGGRVLQAEPMQRSGREVYRLKVLTPEGRVRVLDDSRRREPEARPEPSPERMEPPRQDSGPGGGDGGER